MSKKQPNPNHFNTNRKQSPEHIQKRVETRKKNGKYIVKQEQRDAISKTSKGRKPWNTGKTLSDEHKEKLRQAKLGKKQTEEHKQNSVIARMKLAEEKGYYKPNSERSKKISKKLKGRIIDSEWKKKMSDSWSYEKHVTPESRRKQHESRLNQVFPKKDSIPEKMMQIALQKEGIIFQKHKRLIGQPDIFIEPNLCVFVDGDFWHANPIKFKADKLMFHGRYAKDIWARDIYVNHELTKMGYNVMRIWVSDIELNIDKCAEKIIGLIQNIRELADHKL